MRVAYPWCVMYCIIVLLYICIIYLLYIDYVSTIYELYMYYNFTMYVLHFYYICTVLYTGVADPWLEMLNNALHPVLALMSPPPYINQMSQGLHQLS